MFEQKKLYQNAFTFGTAKCMFRRMNVNLKSIIPRRYCAKINTRACSIITSKKYYLANCASSVEPFIAVVEELPPETI